MFGHLTQLNQINNIHIQISAIPFYKGQQNIQRQVKKSRHTRNFGQSGPISNAGDDQYFL